MGSRRSPSSPFREAVLRCASGRGRCDGERASAGSRPHISRRPCRHGVPVRGCSSRAKRTKRCVWICSSQSAGRRRYKSASSRIRILFEPPKSEAGKLYCRSGTVSDSRPRRSGVPGGFGRASNANCIRRRRTEPGAAGERSASRTPHMHGFPRYNRITLER
mgnify:CR=1 FL=1